MFSGDLPCHFPVTLPCSTLYQSLPPSMIMEEEEEDRETEIIMYNELLPYNDHDYYELVNNNCSHSSSGCEPSYSAVHQVDETKPVNSGLFQRSVSSHSLPVMINNKNNGIDNCGVISYTPAAAVSLGGNHRLVDLIDSCTVRRVFSTGDLQFQTHQLSHHHRSSESPLSNESSSSSIIEGMLSKACRYSPEEKKERIERYKSKRTQRNFNKKIKYACRKTLADSRPRIRGRFARNINNEEDEEHKRYNCGQALEWGNREQQQYEEQWEDNNEDEDDNCWVDLFNAAWSTA